MRIGINALAWRPGQQAGVATYLRQLVAALQEIDGENEYVLLVGGQAAGRLNLNADNFREVVCHGAGPGRAVRAAWEQTALARRVRGEKIEVLLCVGGLVPANLDVPAVQVIHDLQVLHYPENFPWIKRRFLRRMLPRSARAAALTVASSEHTREDVVALLGQTRERTRVVPLAGDPQYQPAAAEAVTRVKGKYGIADDYLLCVATTHRHKNLAGLVEASDQAGGIGERRWELVLAGKGGSGHRELLGAIRRARNGERVRLLGWVPAEELAALYSGATAFVLPSLFEGFGMTVLEAMQCGCPVACSGLTALPEVAGDAVLLFDPRDKAAFASALARIVEDEELRGRLRERGFVQAQRFDWERTARQTREGLFEAGGARS